VARAAGRARGGARRGARVKAIGRRGVKAIGSLWAIGAV
jgi:hypothetical protein